MHVYIHPLLMIMESANQWRNPEKSHRLPASAREKGEE
jgi:hypothetical protein